MTLFDDNPINPYDHNPEPRSSGEASFESPSKEPVAPLFAGDPFSYASLGPAPATSAAPVVPEDLRISWSWPHLLVSIVFFFASQIAIGLVALGYYSLNRHLSQSQLRKFLETDPKFLVGTTILWSAFMLLFLYVTLAVLRDLPFWSSLGWKKFSANPADQKGRPWMYFLSGCGLSLFVAIASSRVKDADHTPIQELFKNRTGALLLMAMAVFVAPLVEETLFRGYLYPVLARIFSSVAQFFGMESPTALRTGVGSSILVTGVLFGLLHAPQLGWTVGLVGLLTLVGVIFTFVRAWTGTVLASFLLHLGYNSFIAIATVIGTKGFTQMPPHP
jgi:membrane protease YdiL (CAAX protease family)